MDTNYVKAIIREMHDELITRDKVFRNHIASGLLTREEANHRYVCLQNAKWLLDAELNGKLAQIPPSKLKSKAEVGAELMTEIKFRKKVFGGKVFKGYMTKFEAERRIGYFEFAHTLLAPPLPKDTQTSLF
jgi:hypothetical protein